MPSAIEQTAAQLVKQPTHLALLPLRPIIHGHGIPRERSNKGVAVGVWTTVARRPARVATELVGGKAIVHAWAADVSAQL